MSVVDQIRRGPALSSQYINGIYIPSTLLLVGVAIVKSAWLPYAAAVAVLLGSWKIYNNRQLDILTSFGELFGHQARQEADFPGGELGARNCLKPDVFQEFYLKEKTIISHNVAM